MSMVQETDLNTSQVAPAPPPFLVLVHAPSWDEAEPIREALLREGFDVHVSISEPEALDLLIAESFDAMVAVGPDSKDLLLQVRQSSPETITVAATRDEERFVRALHVGLMHRPRSRRKFLFQ